MPQKGIGNMKALKPSKTAIAIALASAALVTGCGQNEEVSQAEQETTTTASAAGESITPPAETITNPDTGATAQTGANTDVEYGTTGSSDAASSSNVTAERSGPPAGETSGPHTTTDMLALSPAPAGVDDSVASSDAAESSSTPNVTERTTPDAGANASQQASGSATDEAQQSSVASANTEQQTSGATDQQQASGASNQQSGDTSGAVAGAASGATGAASDTWITTKVKSALLANDQVSGTDIEVETANGEVMLSGFVENQQQIQQAEQAAQQVEGVRQVTTNLKVKQQQ
jgi:hyperosmotically inducible protein